MNSQNQTNPDDIYLGEIQEIESLLGVYKEKIESNFAYQFFPDEGIYRRELYTKHVEFMDEGANFRERAMIAANRIGKTTTAGYEFALHLTGLYPSWWKGRRFGKAVKAWAAGQTSQTVRDIIQLVLLGEWGNFGTGMVPKGLIVNYAMKHNGNGTVEILLVKHVSGDISKVIFKAYDQKIEAFMGTAQDLIWLDEEPSAEIYSECVTRTMTTKGLVLCTFTPLHGLTDVVLSFMPEKRIPTREEQKKLRKFVTQITWDDVPHLDEEAKQDIFNATPPYLREARSKGIPISGVGRIYPIAESEFVIDPIKIPPHWEKAFGFDVGKNRSAVIYGAYDRATLTWYLYLEYYKGQAETSVHGCAIKEQAGDWMPGLIDPASKGTFVETRTFFDIYQTDHGLNLYAANNAVEAGINKVYRLLSEGRLKVFSTCMHWLSEFRVYSTDKNGDVIKKSDHLMDATRYLIMTGLQYAVSGLEAMNESESEVKRYSSQGRSSIGGY